MITLAPNVYVARYLLALDRLGPDMRERLTRNLMVGFQRELTYGLSDGSFSAFGESDGEGSMWLTAFVIQVFAEMAQTPLVTVDASVVSRAADWVTSQQSKDGSFPSVGRVIHSEMMGSVSAGASLTAFVLNALVEARISGLVSGLDEAIEKAKAYLAGLELVVGTAEQTYSLVLAATVRARLGDDTAMSLLSTARKEHDGALASYPAGSAATDVELTGYAVGALVFADELGEAVPAARWLSSVRNDVGGFVSTQDTVVALRALSAFAARAATDVDVTVDLVYGAEANSFRVDGGNFDVLQTWVPSNVTNATATIAVAGTGSALVSSTVTYNVPEDALPSGYDLAVTWGNETGTWVCTVDVTAHEDGERGMLLLEVGLFSGFTAARAKAELMATGHVKRVEVTDGKVIGYLDKPVKGLQFTASEEFEVTGRKPANAKVYEYYDPARQGSAITAFEGVQVGEVIVTKPIATEAPEATTAPPTAQDNGPPARTTAEPEDGETTTASPDRSTTQPTPDAEDTTVAPSSVTRPETVASFSSVVVLLIVALP